MWYFVSLQYIVFFVLRNIIQLVFKKGTILKPNHGPSVRDEKRWRGHLLSSNTLKALAFTVASMGIRVTSHGWAEHSSVSFVGGFYQLWGAIVSLHLSHFLPLLSFSAFLFSFFLHLFPLIDSCLSSYLNELNCNFEEFPKSNPSIKN